MKRSGYFFEILIVLGLLCTLNVNAQNPFDWQQGADGRPFVTSPAATGQYRTDGLDGSSAYSPTIYPIGTDELPSDAYNPTAARENKPGIRTDFGKPEDPGDQSTESPVGDPFVLLFFALAFAATVLFRRKAYTQE